MSLNRTQIVDWLYRCGDIFTKESDFLTGLDKRLATPTTVSIWHRVSVKWSKSCRRLPIKILALSSKTPA
ncbi:phosphoenolpyruvate-dihydroxyacetone phosphotransferase [Klebsiella pneumoniae]|uniref:Phosphoenolpyruvate-dihydroxyacetone phosphotransferase n=1 Tax=Klebsiella pneumoniae TaxID=573 RepID=A0A377VXA5_KLEPN|nr:phosphoenolpyruvate-dihydroxyacetone phosphotransferase [Klebsiella pneumoniae]